MEKTPEVVYHYTSLDTLVKIIDTRQLWSTSIGYLNDTSERSLYISKALKRMPVLLERHPELQRIVDSSPAPPKTPWDFDSAFSAYITSFSSEFDSLPQWRAYTPAGLGVLIGFKVSCLRQAKLSFQGFTHMDSNRQGSLRFSKITYLDHLESDLDDESLIEIYKEAAADFIRKREKNSLISRFDKFIEGRFGTIGSTHKHRCFSYESEFRLILDELYWPMLPIHFRSAKSTLVPYMKLDIPDSRGIFGGAAWDAIAEIGIGPTPNQNLTIPAVAALLFSRGVVVEKISNSSSTFRDL